MFYSVGMRVVPGACPEECVIRGKDAKFVLKYIFKIFVVMVI